METNVSYTTCAKFDKALAGTVLNLMWQHSPNSIIVEICHYLPWIRGALLSSGEILWDC